MTPSYRIGIVGFGIAGGAAAYLLAKAGHEVTVFEQTPVVGPVGAGILLQPAGQMMLSRIGLLDAVIKQAEPIEYVHAVRRHGGDLVLLRYNEIDPDYRAYGVHRGVLFGALYAAACRQGVRICLDHRIVSWREAGGDLYVISSQSGGRTITQALTLDHQLLEADLDAAYPAAETPPTLDHQLSEEHGPFDFLIAADGSRSPMRAASGLRAEIREYEYGAIWAVGPCSQVEQSLYQVVDGTHTLVGLLPIGKERCTLFYGIRCDQMEHLREAGFAAWREQVIAVSPRAEEIFAEVSGFDQTAFVSYRHVSMPVWHSNRILLLGDAAHATSPHLGQGANFALLDAECFAHSLAVGEGYREAFRRYEAQRRGQIRYYAPLTRLLSPFFQSDGRMLGIGRDLALPIMSRISPIRRQMILSMAGLKAGCGV